MFPGVFSDVWSCPDWVPGDSGRKNIKKQFWTKTCFFRSEKALGPARTGPGREKKNRKISALRITGPVAGIRHRAQVARTGPGSRISGTGQILVSLRSLRAKLATNAARELQYHTLPLAEPSYRRGRCGGSATDEFRTILTPRAERMVIASRREWLSREGSV